jgi:hypothetical protein
MPVPYSKNMRAKNARQIPDYSLNLLRVLDGVAEEGDFAVPHFLNSTLQN